MLDALSPAARHAVIALATAVGASVAHAILAWAPGALPALLDDAGLGGYAGAAATLLTLALTPLTRQYGAGADPGDHEE